MPLAIKVENLSKAYQLGEIGTGTISRDLERWIAKVRGKEDPFLKLGETNDRSTKGTSDVVWSLKDIHFEINQGDAVGIIGRNGAGKSTLLKLLSRVTSPTTGNIKVKGRIASLLEVGTGFHPELTGRENIYLNGTILGMRRKEIDRKLDEIIDFSGVERYIDTPVKRYSSGMYVRLAFAVAAHLESEILIVDEVLAVGDAEFQKKCLGKMDDVSKIGGRTVLFVSHNLNFVQNLCFRSILLEKGKKIMDAQTVDVINQYLNNATNQLPELISNKQNLGQKLIIRAIRLKNGVNELTTQLFFGDLGIVEIDIDVYEHGHFYNISFELINHKYGSIFTSSFMDIDTVQRKNKVWQKGSYRLSVQLPLTFLREGQYIIRASAAKPSIEILDVFSEDLIFSYANTKSPIIQLNEGRQGAILPILSWDNYLISK